MHHSPKVGTVIQISIIVFTVFLLFGLLDKNTFGFHLDDLFNIYDSDSLATPGTLQQTSIPATMTPEPATLLFLGIGLLCIVMLIKIKNK